MNIQSQRADKIYETILPKVKDLKGQFVAIELDTGDYFIGKTMEEAYDKGSKKYPEKQFYFKRIGFKAALFVGALSA